MGDQRDPQEAASLAKSYRIQLETVRGQIETEIADHKATLGPLRVQESQLLGQISYFEAQAGTAVAS